MRKRNRQNRSQSPTPPVTAAGATVASPEVVAPAFAGALQIAPANVVAFDGELASDSDALSHTILIRDVAMFRTGDYGPKGKFTDEDLAELEFSYDPEWLEAPITIDHEQTGPALGWIENIKARDGILYGDFLVSRECFDAMQRGAYKRRSIEIYRGVPKDGKKVQYVKACSILGAATPEVKGLPPVKFHEGFAPYEQFEFSEESAPQDGEETHQMEATMPEVINNTPAASAAAPLASSFASMTEAQFNEVVQKKVDAALANATASHEKQLKEAEDRAARFAEGLSAVNDRLLQSDEAARFNAVAVEAAQAGRLSRVERDFLAAIFNSLPYDAPDAANAVKFFASDAPEGTEPELITPRGLVLRYMEVKVPSVSVDGKLLTTGQPHFASSPGGPTHAQAADPVERSKWIDKRASELHTADPSKDFGECMLTAERELLAKK